MWSETIIEEPSHSYTMKGGKKQKRQRALTIPRMLTMDAYVPDEMVFERSMSPVQMVSEEMMDDFYDEILNKYDISVKEYDPEPVIYKSDNEIGYQKVYHKEITVKPKKTRKNKKKTKKTRKSRK